MKRTTQPQEIDKKAKLAEIQARSKISRERNRAIKEQQRAEESRKDDIRRKADSEVHPPLSVAERAAMLKEIDSMRADLELIRKHRSMTKELNRAIFYIRNVQDRDHLSFMLNG